MHEPEIAPDVRLRFRRWIAGRVARNVGVAARTNARLQPRFEELPDEQGGFEVAQDLLMVGELIRLAGRSPLEVELLTTGAFPAEIPEVPDDVRRAVEAWDHLHADRLGGRRLADVLAGKRSGLGTTVQQHFDVLAASILEMVTVIAQDVLRESAPVESATYVRRHTPHMYGKVADVAALVRGWARLPADGTLATTYTERLLTGAVHLYIDRMAAVRDLAAGVTATEELQLAALAREAFVFQYRDAVATAVADHVPRRAVERERAEELARLRLPPLSRTPRRPTQVQGPGLDDVDRHAAQMLRKPPGPVEAEERRVALVRAFELFEEDATALVVHSFTEHWLPDIGEHEPDGSLADRMAVAAQTCAEAFRMSEWGIDQALDVYGPFLDRAVAAHARGQLTTARLEETVRGLQHMFAATWKGPADQRQKLHEAIGGQLPESWQRHTRSLPPGLGAARAALREAFGRCTLAAVERTVRPAQPPSPGGDLLTPKFHRAMATYRREEWAQMHAAQRTAALRGVPATGYVVPGGTTFRGREPGRGLATSLRREATCRELLP